MGISKRTMRFHLLVLSALVAVDLANEDVFLKWAKEQGKQYKTKAELTMRQAIFMKNYNRMVEHNKDFDAGKDQKHCGSCAAFTTVAIVESCFAQQTGVITDLFEEHLVNCMATNGCSGWYTNQYLDDLVSSNGGRLEQEYCCSYTATDGHCSDDNSCDYTSASVTG